MEKNSIARKAIMAMMTCVCMALFGFYMANASDPSPLQDFCIAADELHSAVLVNGRICKNPKDVKVSDFMYKGFDKPGDTANNIQKATNTRIGVDVFPGLNTLGVSLGRVDYAPSGLNVPHLHPRSSELFTVIEGTLYAGFVTTDNKLFDTVLTKGDMIVFPQSLIHFQINIGNTYAYAITAFGSQFPGRIDLPNVIFGAMPPILDDVLIKAFAVSVTDIARHRAFLSNGTIDKDEGRSFLNLISERPEYVNKDNIRKCGY